MSDSVRVRAIAPTIYGPDNDRLYKAGDDWEADRDVVQPLIDQGQLEEVKEPSLLIVPEVGLYLPSENQPAPPVIKGKGSAN